MAVMSASLPTALALLLLFFSAAEAGTAAPSSTDTTAATIETTTPTTTPTTTTTPPPPTTTTTTTTTTTPPTTTKAPLNGPCTDPPGCSVANAACISGTCTCNATYFENGGQCVPATSVTPGSLQVSRGVGNVSLSWIAPSVGSVATVTGYEVRQNGTVIASPSVTSQQVTGLSPNVDYTFQVVAKISYRGTPETSGAATVPGKPLSTENQACSVDGDCASSANLVCPSGTCRCTNNYFWNTACVPVSSLLPQNVTTSEVATNLFRVSWAPSTTQSPYPLSYVVTWQRQQSGGAVGEHVTSSSDTTHLITTLTPGDAILVTVNSRINEGFRNQTTTSAPATVNLRPEEPVGLVYNASMFRNNSMDLVFDGVSLGFADTYRVTLNGVTKTVTDSSNVNGTAARLSVTFEGLSPGTTYTLTIVAVSHGVEGNRSVTTVRTSSTGPSAVTGFNISKVTTTSMVVTWSQPERKNGRLFAYVLRVLRDAFCVNTTIFNCTDCQGTGEVKTPDCDGQSAIIINNDTIGTENHTLTHTIDGLNPDVSYKVIVYGYTDGGKGMDEDKIERTSIAAAQAPGEVSTTALNSSAVRLSWVPHQPRPGPTTYHIVVAERDAQPGYVYNHVQSVTVSGFENNQTDITGLKSYWEYQISISASTEVQESQQVTKMASPKMSAPGHVAYFNVTKKNVNTVTITVLCPTLENRNGKIAKYNITYKKEPWYPELGSVSEGAVVITEGATCSSQERVGVAPLPMDMAVIPEHNYTFTVNAVNADNASGPMNMSDYRAEPGPPPTIPPNSQPTPSPSVFDTYIVVPVCKSCVLNNSSGIIRYAGVVVCKEGSNCNQSRRRRNVRSQSYYEGLPSFVVAEQNGFNSEFRATDDNFVYQLKNSQDATYPVNVGNKGGGLPRGATFLVKIFTCTNGGCYETSYIGGFRTNPDHTPAIVGGVVGGILAAIVVILIVVLILYKRKAGPWSKPSDSSDVIIPDVPKQEIPRKRPVKLKDFNQHVYEMHKDSNLRFSEEFEDLTSLSPKHPKDVGSRDDCKVKNRYVNILPFDHSRVKLLPLSEHDSSDYINANYLPGYNAVREYIACQGALAHTVSDFWRMIWEQKCNVIVCLSDLMEKGRAKVDQYWPSEVNSPETYGEIEVETTSSSTLNKYVIRVFNVSLGDESRQVKQFFLPGWEDYSANLTPDDVIEFIKMVRLERKPSDPGPMVVHCSAGVGRTGTFIALDVVQQFIRDKDLEAKLDIFALVLRMRENREYMVQTEKQYIFIFDTTKEILDRKIKAQQELDHIYGNDENVYENQGFTNDADIYVNMENGKPTTQL